jgi:hypothetical protein
MLRQDMSVPRRFAEMDVELERVGLLRRTRLGWGTLLYLPSAAAVHEYIVERLQGDPFYLVARNARKLVEKKCQSH